MEPSGTFLDRALQRLDARIQGEIDRKLEEQFNKAILNGVPHAHATAVIAKFRAQLLELKAQKMRMAGDRARGECADIVRDLETLSRTTFMRGNTGE